MLFAVLPSVVTGVSNYCAAKVRYSVTRNQEYMAQEHSNLMPSICWGQSGQRLYRALLIAHGRMAVGQGDDLEDG